MWTHVAATFDGANLSLYINGAASGSQGASASTIPVGPRSLRIGADSSGGSNFNGQIDEPRVWNRALSASEISSIFFQGTNCP
jgi:hypothetical protein